MIDYFLERRHKVLMARITGDFDAEQISQLDRIAEALAAREPALRAIYDFTDLTDLRIPAAEIAQRARKPTAVGGLRIIVSSRAMRGGMARDFSSKQSIAGERAPMVVSSIEQAYVLLDLGHKAKFVPFDPGID